MRKARKSSSAAFDEIHNRSFGEDMGRGADVDENAGVRSMVKFDAQTFVN